MISGSSTEASTLYRNMMKIVILQEITDGVTLRLDAIHHAASLSLSSVLPLSRPLASPSSLHVATYLLKPTNTTEDSKEAEE